MKKLIYISLIVFSLLNAGSVFAEAEKSKKEKGTIDKPIITTWSKIKEIFE